MENSGLKNIPHNVLMERMYTENLVTFLNPAGTLTVDQAITAVKYFTQEKASFLIFGNQIRKLLGETGDWKCILDRTALLPNTLEAKVRAITKNAMESISIHKNYN